MEAFKHKGIKAAAVGDNSPGQRSSHLKAEV